MHQAIGAALKTFEHEVEPRLGGQRSELREVNDASLSLQPA
jgi:UDP-galactopyranose mutase